jgi:hypothetical protein
MVGTVEREPLHEMKTTRRAIGVCPLPDATLRNKLVNAVVALAACYFAVSSPLQAQGWDATLIIDPFPSPYLSDWQTNPNVASLTVFNNTGRTGETVVHYTVVDASGRVLLTGRSDPLTVLSGTPTVFSTTSTIGGYNEYDPELEDLVIRTGRFPESDYTACIFLTDASGFVLVDNVCSEFSTFYPDPPYLLYPMDDDTLGNAQPIFEWTPVQVPIEFPVTYVVQVAEILANQTPLLALTANILQHEDGSLFAPYLEYPLGGYPLENGKRYAWWVQALDQDGTPPATNEGRSEIWTFVYDETFDDFDDVVFGDAGDVTLVHADNTGESQFADLGRASFQSVQQRIANLESGDDVVLPLPFDELNLFGEVPLSNVSVEMESASRTLVVAGDALLLGQTVDLVLLGVWAESGPGAFTLGIRAYDFGVDDLVADIEASALADLDLTNATLTLSNSSQMLDSRTLPAAVEDFYDGETLSLRPGLNLQSDVDLTQTSLAPQLLALGVEDGSGVLEGVLGVDPNALFDNAGARPASGLNLVARLGSSDVAWFPDWLSAESIALEFAVNSPLTVMFDAPSSAALNGDNFSFSLQADLSELRSATAHLTGSVGTMTVPEILSAVSDLLPDSWTLPAGMENFEGLALDTGSLDLGFGLDPAGADSMWARIDGDGHLDLISGGSFAAGGRFDFKYLGGETWVGGDVRVDVGAVTVPEALTTVGEILQGGWTLPSEVENFEALGLDTASLRLGFSASPAGLDSVWAGVSGVGHLTLVSGSDFTAGGSFAFKRIREDNWVSGNVDVDVGAVTVTEALTTVTDLLPGDWVFPSEVESLDVLGLDTASLTLGFATGPQGLDSLWADVSGAGHVDLVSGSTLGAGGSFAFKRVAEDNWVSGHVQVDVGAVTVTQALTTATEMLPGDWALPDGVESFDALGLDTASLGLGFAVSPAGLDSIWAGVSGEGQIDLVSGSQFAAGGSFAFKRVASDNWVSGHMQLDVGAVTVTEALTTVTDILPGDWEFPADVQDFDVLGLDTASVGLGFSVSPAGLDSLWAGVSGSGQVDLVSGSQFAAGGHFAFKRVASDNWVSGHVEVDVGAVTVTEALTTVTEILPGDWVLPADAQDFDVLSLDTASLGLGFSVSPTGLDSLWAAVGGSGQVELASGSEFAAGGHFAFKRVARDNWVSGDIQVDVGAVTVTEALTTATDIMPGDWELPADAESFDALALDTASLGLGFSVSPAGLDSLWAHVSGGGRIDMGRDEHAASGAFAFKRVGTDTWVAGDVDVRIGRVKIPEAFDAVTELLPGEWSMPADVEDLDVLTLDGAALGLGFSVSPAGLDSLWAHVSGAGRLDLPRESSELAASGAFAFKRVGTDTWVSGDVDVRIGQVTVPEVLTTVTDLLPGDWALPGDVESFEALTLDRAALGFGFSASPAGLDSLWAHVSGAGRVDLPRESSELEASGAFSFKSVDTDPWASGDNYVRVGEVTVTEALTTVTDLLPGDWVLPTDVESLDVLTLNRAAVRLGFGASPAGLDSLFAGVSGAGTVDLVSGSQFAADGVFAFKRVDVDNWVSAHVNVDVGAVTVTEALETVTELLPGEWTLPSDAESFDVLGLDTASLGLGFSVSPAGLDSVWADVSGEGQIDLVSGSQFAADGAFAFKRVDVDNWVSAHINVDVGAVTVTEALETVTELLPGEWTLPSDAESFDVLG